MKKIEDRLQEHLIDIKDKNILALILQGSQNYGVDQYTEDYQSDVDTKAIIIPSFNNFCLREDKISTTFIRENDEHIDLKDIKSMFEQFKKNNPSYLELLYSNYKWINPNYTDFWDKIIDNRENFIDDIRFGKCVYGMALEKKKALCHPYPATAEKIEKYGFDPKQLHHIIRLYYLIQNFVRFDKLYFDTFDLEDKERDEKRKKILIDLKTKGIYNGHILSAEEAEECADNYIILIKNITDNLITFPTRYCADNVLDDLLVDILKYSFKEELKNDTK